MLKRTILAAALALSAVPLAALPLGNPLDASWLGQGILWEGRCDDTCDACCSCLDAWSIRFGYYGDFVFDRRLEVDSSENDSDIRKTRIITNAAYFAFNVWDRFDLFATFGQTKFHIETPASAFSATGSSIIITDVLSVNPGAEVETETYFSWSIGARGTIWECGRFGIGAEGQYFYTRPRLNYFEIGTLDVGYFNNTARTNYREYQFGLGATYQIPIAGCGTFVVPYVGVKWSRALFDLGEYVINLNFIQLAQFRAVLHKLTSHHHTGAVIGVTLVGCERWSLTAEGRFADEFALHINSQIRF